MINDCFFRFEVEIQALRRAFRVLFVKNVVNRVSQHNKESYCHFVLILQALLFLRENLRHNCNAAKLNWLWTWFFQNSRHVLAKIIYVGVLLLFIYKLFRALGDACLCKNWICSNLYEQHPQQACFSRGL